jgi:hypothetical protein
VAFVSGKIEESLKEHCPNLGDDPAFKQLLLKEMLYYLIEGANIFGTQNVTEVAGHE